MDIKKKIAIILIVCLTLGLAGCSSIGYCADDESSMKIVAKLLNKAPLKDKEREYFISYPDCLDAA